MGWYVIFAIANTSLTGWLKSARQIFIIIVKLNQISAESDEQLNNYIRKARGRQARKTLIFPRFLALWAVTKCSKNKYFDATFCGLPPCTFFPFRLSSIHNLWITCGKLRILSSAGFPASDLLSGIIDKSGTCGIVDLSYPHFHISLWKCGSVHRAARIWAV